jgi:CheY-like chemotaxis protein
MQRSPPGDGESAITLLIAESCQMNCELMAAALDRSPYPLSVVAAATDSEEVLKHYSSRTLDVCIIGSRLKGGARSGLSVTRELCRLHPSAKVIVLLDSEQPQLVIEAFRAGAKGIFSREEPFEAFARAPIKFMKATSGRVTGTSTILNADQTRAEPCAICCGGRNQPRYFARTRAQRTHRPKLPVSNFQ